MFVKVITTASCFGGNERQYARFQGSGLFTCSSISHVKCRSPKSLLLRQSNFTEAHRTI